jgi:hypothetical protein
MDALPEFALLRPTTLDEALRARAAHPASQLLGGGTDLMVNMRRGIAAPPVLIDTNRVAELRAITADAGSLAIGASVTLAELAAHPQVVKHYPWSRRPPASSPGRRSATWAPSAAMSASTRAASSTIKANGGARQSPLPQDHRRHLPRRAEEPRRLLCDLQRRPRPAC